MKFAWFNVLVSALTDFGIVVSAGLVSSMMTSGQVIMPSAPVVLVNVLLGLGAALRTVQQALKATPETAAALKGDVSEVKTTTIERTP